MKLLDAVLSRLDPPKEFHISCAADWCKIPFGFLRVQSNGHESLAFHHAVFGVLRDVKPTFTIGAVVFRLDRPVSELPIVRVNVVVAQPGVMRVNGRIIVDTEKGLPDESVEYEPSAI